MRQTISRRLMMMLLLLLIFILLMFDNDIYYSNNNDRYSCCHAYNAAVVTVTRRFHGNSCHRTVQQHRHHHHHHHHIRIPTSFIRTNNNNNNNNNNNVRRLYITKPQTPYSNIGVLLSSSITTSDTTADITTPTAATTSKLTISTETNDNIESNVVTASDCHCCSSNHVKQETTFAPVPPQQSSIVVIASTQARNQSRLYQYQQPIRPQPQLIQNTNNNNNNPAVLRNVHQSTIPPHYWEHSLVPPLPPVSLSLWNTVVATAATATTAWNKMNGNRKNGDSNFGTDVSVDWTDETSYIRNTTAPGSRHDTIITTATAERLLDLYDEQYHNKNVNKRRKMMKNQWLSSSSSSSSSMQRQPNQYLQQRQAMIDDIATGMNVFRTFCYNARHAPRQRSSGNNNHTSSEFESDPPLSFTIRLVGTYGRRSSAKCPIWHIDHVPCRYIQSLSGPTCMFIATNDANRIVYDRIMTTHHQQDDSIKQEEFTSVEERNAVLLRNIDDSHNVVVGQAAVGEGMILLGNGWSEWTTGTVDGCCTATPGTQIDTPRNQDHTNRQSPPSTVGVGQNTVAAVHKSPLITQPKQGRILLTINVHENNNNNINNSNNRSE